MRNKIEIIKKYDFSACPHHNHHEYVMEMELYKMGLRHSKPVAHSSASFGVSLKEDRYCSCGIKLKKQEKAFWICYCGTENSMDNKYCRKMLGDGMILLVSIKDRQIVL